MRQGIHHTKEWNFTVNIVLFGILFLLFYEMAFMSSEGMHTHEGIAMVDIFLTLVLVADLVLWYREAKDKYSFVRRNWVKIIAVFPFTLCYGALRIFQFERIMPMVVSGEWVAEITALEKIAHMEKGIKVFSKGSELMEKAAEVVPVFSVKPGSFRLR